MRATFLFVGHLNGQQEWLGYITTNRHVVAAFDFTTVSGCDQLVVDPTHERGWTLNQFMTDFPDLLRVAVGNSHHSSLSVVISMVRAVLNLCVSKKVFMKDEVNCMWYCTGSAMA